MTDNLKQLARVRVMAIRAMLAAGGSSAASGPAAAPSAAAPPVARSSAQAPPFPGHGGESSALPSDCKCLVVGLGVVRAARIGRILEKIDAFTRDGRCVGAHCRSSGAGSR